jgi:hypothetical protein
LPAAFGAACNAPAQSLEAHNPLSNRGNFEIARSAASAGTSVAKYRAGAPSTQTKLEDVMSATTLTANVTGYRFPGLDRGANYVGRANRVAGTVVMLGAAPLIGLAFVVVLPFAGLALAAWLAAKALLANRLVVWRRVRNVVLFLAAPFIGLAYAVALPFVGLGAVVWLGLGAARKRRAAA